MNSIVTYNKRKKVQVFSGFNQDIPDLIDKTDEDDAPREYAKNKHSDEDIFNSRIENFFGVEDRY